MSQKDPVNILLVDDQPAKLLTYEVILSELGENLIKAESAREALEYLLKNDIAIILTDVVMPDLDGFELAAMIRAHPRFQKIAIMFVSALALSDIDRVKACEHGAVDYDRSRSSPSSCGRRFGFSLNLTERSGSWKR